jgi:hypothetical protein
MPRKKAQSIQPSTDNSEKPQQENMEVQQVSTTGKEESTESESRENEEPRQWGDPYRAVYTNKELGFELGEDRRFKQRIFKFRDKPSQEWLDKLKAAGYRYRPQEKSWTVSADAVTRVESERLAAEFAKEGVSEQMMR